MINMLGLPSVPIHQFGDRNFTSGSLTFRLRLASSPLIKSISSIGADNSWRAASIVSFVLPSILGDLRVAAVEMMGTRKWPGELDLGRWLAVLWEETISSCSTTVPRFNETLWSSPTRDFKSSQRCLRSEASAFAKRSAWFSASDCFLFSTNDCFQKITRNQLWKELAFEVELKYLECLQHVILIEDTGKI